MRLSVSASSCPGHFSALHRENPPPPHRCRLRQGGLFLTQNKTTVSRRRQCSREDGGVSVAFRILARLRGYGRAHACACTVHRLFYTYLGTLSWSQLFRSRFRALWPRLHEGCHCKPQFGERHGGCQISGKRDMGIGYRRVASPGRGTGYE